jgi:hypothetical protein
MFRIMNRTKSIRKKSLRTRLTSLPAYHFDHYVNQLKKPGFQSKNFNSGNKFCERGKGFPVRGIELLMRGKGFPIRGIELLMRGKGFPIKGIELSMRGKGFPVRGIELLMRGETFPVRGIGFSMRGNESPVRGIEFLMNGNGISYQRQPLGTSGIITLMRIFGHINFNTIIIMSRITNFKN